MIPPSFYEGLIVKKNYLVVYGMLIEYLKREKESTLIGNVIVPNVALGCNIYLYTKQVATLESIECVMFEVSDDLLTECDMIENVSSGMYERVSFEVFDKTQNRNYTAWMYIGGNVMPNGSFGYDRCPHDEYYNMILCEYWMHGLPLKQLPPSFFGFDEDVRDNYRNK